MLDQQVVNLANDRMRLEIADQIKRVREGIIKIEQEMIVRGLGQGAILEQVASLCSEATRDRTQTAWRTLSRFVTTSGLKYYDSLADNLKRVIAEHLPENLGDLKGFVKQEVEKLGCPDLISQLQTEVENARASELAKIYGEIELFVISLKEAPSENEEKDDNPLLLKPSMYGVGVDLPKAFKWLKKKFGCKP